MVYFAEKNKIFYKDKKKTCFTQVLRCTTMCGSLYGNDFDNLLFELVCNLR